MMYRCFFESHHDHGRYSYYIVFFFFNDTATTEIYTLSLHDALPICGTDDSPASSTTTANPRLCQTATVMIHTNARLGPRSEEHTSELQSRQYLVCRLLLEKKKKKHNKIND